MQTYSLTRRPGIPVHAASYAGPTPIPNRRPSNVSVNGSGTSPSPQLFDFTKTDRRPSQTTKLPPTSSRSISASTLVPASLPNTSSIHARQQAHFQAVAQARTVIERIDDEMELDMEFDGDDDDDGEITGSRSGSAEIDMDEDDDGEIKGKGKEWEKLALGTGSGGVKGRRKGMVFKCENCSKVGFGYGFLLSRHRSESGSAGVRYFPLVRRRLTSFRRVQEYRHPSCLIKHRWEHSPHWKEPTQLSMSKHQQVQMLEVG